MMNTLLYQGDSLETYLKIKNILNDNQVDYEEKIQNGGSAGDFLTKLFVFGQGSMGLNDERRQTYHIFVEEADYEKAVRVLKSNSGDDLQNCLETL